MASKSQLATRSSLTLFPVPPQSARLREGLSWLPFKWPLGRRKGIKSCARGRTGPGGERGAAVVPTMVFLSRYVVGGVARNVQGNEHLALLPIPFQLPVVGAQEKEGREAGVIAHRRARPQRRPQQQRQEESPRGPATALHAAAAAARPERRSLIQFGRRRDGGATRREGEEAADASRAGSGAEPRSSAGDRGLQSFFGPRGERDPGCGLRERVVRRLRAPPPPRRLCATPLGQAWESARPPPHLLKAPGAESPPRAAATRVPAAPPPPRAALRAPARPPPSRARSPAPRETRGVRLPGPGRRSALPPGRAAEGRDPEEGVGLGVLLGATGAANLQQGTEKARRERTSRQLSGGAQGEDRPLWPSDFPLFPERRRGGRRGLVGPALAAAALSAPPAPRAPRGSPASELWRPALVLGIRPRPRTARGPCAPFPSRPRVPPAAPRPVPRRSDRASSVAGF